MGSCGRRRVHVEFRIGGDHPERGGTMKGKGSGSSWRSRVPAALLIAFVAVTCSAFADMAQGQDQPPAPSPAPDALGELARVTQIQILIRDLEAEALRLFLKDPEQVDLIYRQIRTAAQGIRDVSEKIRPCSGPLDCRDPIYNTCCCGVCQKNCPIGQCHPARSCASSHECPFFAPFCCAGRCQRECPPHMPPDPTPTPGTTLETPAK